MQKRSKLSLRQEEVHRLNTLEGKFPEEVKRLPSQFQPGGAEAIKANEEFIKQRVEKLRKNL